MSRMPRMSLTYVLLFALLTFTCCRLASSCLSEPMIWDQGENFAKHTVLELRRSKVSTFRSGRCTDDEGKQALCCRSCLNLALSLKACQLPQKAWSSLALVPETPQATHDQRLKIDRRPKATRTAYTVKINDVPWARKQFVRIVGD